MSKDKKSSKSHLQKILSIDNILEIEPNYSFKYLVRPDGSYTISRFSGEQWSISNIEVDYKLLRAWKDEKVTTVGIGVSKGFKKKYDNIDFEF